MLSSWTLAFPLLLLTDSAHGELNSWVWGSFCKLCVLWLVSLDNLVQLLSANLYFPLCLKWPLCKRYLKTSADKQQLIFTYPKKEECGTNSRVLNGLVTTASFLHYSGIILLISFKSFCWTFQLRSLRNLTIIPQQKLSSGTGFWWRKQVVLTNVCNIYKRSSFCFTVEMCYNGN